MSRSPLPLAESRPTTLVMCSITLHFSSLSPKSKSDKENKREIDAHSPAQSEVEEEHPNRLVQLKSPFKMVHKSPTSSVPSGIYLHPISLTLNPPPPPSHSSHSSPSTSPSSSPSPSYSSTTRSPLPAHLPDHYAILHLDTWATSEEIKAAYRNLRLEYFRSDPAKYRALQAAYAVLVDAEARRKYDIVYRASKGLPVPVCRPSTLTAEKEKENQGENLRYNGNKDAKPNTTAEVQTQRKLTDSKTVQQSRLGRVQRQANKLEDVISASAAARLSTEKKIPMPSDIKKPQLAVDTSLTQQESSISPLRAASPVEAALPIHDPNRALKMHVFNMKHYSNTVQHCYQSYIPILEAYRGRRSHPELLCMRPKYVSGLALV